MLHKVKASHGDILKGLPELTALLPRSVRKKRQLLDMAARGEPRPKQKTTLGLAFGYYTRKKSPVHDPIFTKKIRKLAPSWFVSAADEAALKKRTLIRAAKNGDPRPKDSEKMGALLYSYLVKDKKFAAAIKRTRPDWLVANVQRNKESILCAARRGEPKPKCPGLLGRALSNYTRKNSQVHDPKFTREIKKLAPHWLVGQTERANSKKQLLLDMARRGDAKPLAKTQLGTSLKSYFYKSSPGHDPEFARKIRKLAPRWFRKFRPCSTR